MITRACNTTPTHHDPDLRNRSLPSSPLAWIAILLMLLGAVPGAAQLGRVSFDSQGDPTKASIEGCAWQPGFHGLGPNEEVTASTVFDDGSGPALFIGGKFRDVEGVPGSGLAKWDGTAWHPLRTGINGPGLALGVHVESPTGMVANG